MRLIDADAFIVDSVKNKRFVFHTEDIINNAIIVETVYGDLMDALNNAPTVDAVEVVRCKECIYYDPRKFLPCTRLGLFITDEFFCGVGKKAEEVTNDA